MQDPLKQLAIADPDLAAKVKTVLDQKADPIPLEDIVFLVNETLWALSEEISFGKAVAGGYADLIGETSAHKIESYRDLVRKFGHQGPTLGRIMATYLAPVCKYGDKRLLKLFLETFEAMLTKGTYTLKDPLQALSALIKKGELESASVYLKLLGDTFAGDLSYVQSQHFAYSLPRAIQAFPSSRRGWQIEQLRRLVRADSRLVDPFLDGIEKGLHLLSKEALNRFVSLGLEKFSQNRKLAAKFLSLESKIGLDTFAGMQVTVPLTQVQPQLNRYLRARTGLAIAVRPLSELPDALLNNNGRKTFVCSDGKFIYLPAEISKFSQKTENTKLFKCLVKLEAGLYELGTFDFDLERALQHCQSIGDCGFKGVDLNKLNIAPDAILNQKSKIKNDSDLSDLERFFSLFPVPALAADLFTVFEHGRLRILLGRKYPGLVRQTTPVLQQEAVRMLKQGKAADVVSVLYLRLALDFSAPKTFGIDKEVADYADQIANTFEEALATNPTVEICAALVNATYSNVAGLLKEAAKAQRLEKLYKPLQTPFGRRLHPDLFFTAYRKFDQIAAKLQTKLLEKDLQVYKSDIRRHLIAKNGAISLDDIKVLIISPQNNRKSDAPMPETTVDLSWLDLAKFFDAPDITPLPGDDFAGPVFWYREWDCNLQDYLAAHVRVLDRNIPESAGNFYDETLRQHQGLVRRIRYAFELLKPEGLVRLRQWIEGDEFDYRALLDFAIDKKAGKIPSDRLYIKHIKQVRDVAVLLLVDLSRSTANIVPGSQATVLGVEKEAIVLFCEALEVVGDAFAIAGFSGTGRLGVDYFRIKDFADKMDDDVKQRINAMAPQRSTRMGAAIRHAAGELEKVSAKVRLLIMLGDGFPNDVDYKQDYAVCDTAKAIFEARSQNIYVHAITVNMASDPKLDELYGNIHHNVISDVRELPDKLLRIYGGLTKY